MSPSPTRARSVKKKKCPEPGPNGLHVGTRQVCRPLMPTKALSCKKEAICEHGLEAPSCPVGKGSFKMDCFKVEKCSMVRRVQI